MLTYMIKGRVLPVRAMLSIGTVKFQVTPLERGTTVDIELSVYCNEVTIYYSTQEQNLNIFDIKNECLNIVNSFIAQIGYYFGYGYNIEINQILCRDINLNYVFDIGIPCLIKRNDPANFINWMQFVMSIKGDESIFLQRCFVDLQLSITHPIDTPFYCYRAIESLRHFCRIRYQLTEEKQQWQKLSDLTGKNLDDIKSVKAFANDARHGNHRNFTSDQRAEFFISTWDIVDAFLKNIEESQQFGSQDAPTSHR
jgi:hypothetical protein